MTATAAFWNGIAQEYAVKPVENPDAFERKINIIKSKMGTSDVVLDVGCGTGSLALRLAATASQLHGLDVSTEMLRIARDKADALNVHNTTFYTGAFDTSFNVFEPESFDAICAFSILHLLPDRLAAMQKIYRLLKPGGFFISSTVCLGGTWIPYRPILRVLRWIGKAPTVHVFSTQSLVDEMDVIGFGEIEQPDVGAKTTTAFVVAQKPFEGLL